MRRAARLYYNGVVRHTGRRYGILPGAFNPPTEAHLALARSALSEVDEVIFVLPRKMPHKDYAGVPFETRLELLLQATADNPRFSVTDTAGGLFIDIARDLRPRLPEHAEIHILCGRDAAERTANWDYGFPGAFAAMLEEFRLLVAPRDGNYAIPEQYKMSIANLSLSLSHQGMSATQVRESIREGRQWEHLVPASIRERVRLLYGGGGPNNR